MRIISIVSVIQTCGIQSLLWRPCYKELPPTPHPPPLLHLREAQLREVVQNHTYREIYTRTHHHENWHAHTGKLIHWHACMKTIKNFVCTCSWIQKGMNSPHMHPHTLRGQNGASEAINETLSVAVLLWSTCLMCPVALILWRDRGESDRESRWMCQTTGQRDIYDMHGSPFDKNTAERGVEVW